jgi:hypothetical protein
MLLSNKHVSEVLSHCLVRRHYLPKEEALSFMSQIDFVEAQCSIRVMVLACVRHWICPGGLTTPWIIMGLIVQRAGNVDTDILSLSVTKGNLQSSNILTVL